MVLSVGGCWKVTGDVVGTRQSDMTRLHLGPPWEGDEDGVGQGWGGYHKYSATSR